MVFVVVVVFCEELSVREPRINQIRVSQVLGLHGKTLGGGKGLCPAEGERYPPPACDLALHTWSGGSSIHCV